MAKLTFKKVLQEIEKYIPSSLLIIDKAYQFSKTAHEGQTRLNGDPYIFHLIEVAHILVSLKMDETTICAGILHDTIEDCQIPFATLASEFNEEVANLVESLSKIDKISENFKSKEDFVAANQRKIFLAMSKDIRVIIIKLADRLHNMRTLNFMSLEKQVQISQETLDVYIPIAHRLGINLIKSEMEDLCLKYLNLEKFDEVVKLLATHQQKRKYDLELITSKINDLLLKDGYQFSISGRIKNIYSIYKKIYIKHRAFEQIYDLQAIKIVTPNNTNCYEILGIIHANYRPLPNRFKDYIAMPKPNMYQSLHTTIIASDGLIFEVQIKTEEMDRIAETGIASHWSYKEDNSKDYKKRQREIEEKLSWLRNFQEISDEDKSSATDYIKSLQRDIFEANVYVFSPKGKIIDLPPNSTPIDFAYKIHTNVGHSMIGAMVNGMLVPLNTVLKTGDIIEIKTSKVEEPSEGWLKIAQTNYAKNHIRKFLLKRNGDNRQNLIEKGQSLINDEISSRTLDEKEVIRKLSNARFLKIFNFDTIEDLYFAVGSKSLQASSLLDRFSEKKEEKSIIDQIKTPLFKKKTHSTGIVVKGSNNLKIALSKCCNPIPFDQIIGYISKGEGIKVHRCDCPNIINVDTRLIEVEWDQNKIYDLSSSSTEILIQAIDRNNLISDIINFLSQNKIKIISANASSTKDKVANILLRIGVKDSKHCQQIISSLSAITGIIKIERKYR